jgi:antitoxin component YwqK of YwqJK toxin-antitoxin module
MKKLTPTLLTCLIFLSPNVVMSDTINDLVERDGLMYKKFTEVPFTGKITSIEQGSFKNGKKEGAWVVYWNNGRLREKGNWKNGKYEGAYIDYYKNGQLSAKGNYKNGKREGAWVVYSDNGQLLYKGNWKNGKEN